MALTEHGPGDDEELPTPPEEGPAEQKPEALFGIDPPDPDEPEWSRQLREGMPGTEVFYRAIFGRPPPYEDESKAPAITPEARQLMEDLVCHRLPKQVEEKVEFTILTLAGRFRSWAIAFSEVGRSVGRTLSRNWTVMNGDHREN